MPGVGIDLPAKLCGRAAEAAGDRRIDISLTRSWDNAAAVAVAESR